MSFCIHLLNSEVTCLDMESQDEGSYQDSVGTVTLHLCSNSKGKVPTIILICRGQITHTHTYHKTIRHSNTQVIIFQMYLFFVSLFLFPPYVVIKTISNFWKWVKYVFSQSVVSICAMSKSTWDLAAKNSDSGLSQSGATVVSPQLKAYSVSFAVQMIKHIGFQY